MGDFKRRKVGEASCGSDLPTVKQMGSPENSSSPFAHLTTVLYAAILSVFIEMIISNFIATYILHLYVHARFYFCHFIFSYKHWSTANLSISRWTNDIVLLCNYNL